MEDDRKQEILEILSELDKVKPKNNTGSVLRILAIGGSVLTTLSLIIGIIVTMLITPIQASLDLERNDRLQCIKDLRYDLNLLANKQVNEVSELETVISTFDITLRGLERETSTMVERLDGVDKKVKTQIDHINNNQILL